MSEPERVDMKEREALQRAVYDFVQTWHSGMNLKYEGVELGECLEYNMTQMIAQQVLEQFKSQSSS